MELATAIRMRHGLRTPDALQASSVLQLRTDHVCLTGDKAFKRVTGLRVILLVCLPCTDHYNKSRSHC